MSGTSLDGVSAALVRLDPPHHWELVASRGDAYSQEDRCRLLDAIEGGGPRELALLHVWLAERFATSTERLLASAGIEPAQLAGIAMHGQTVWHEPGRVSLQLGDPAVLAERFLVPVVSDFRSRDVAAGGQGAPLVPLVDAMLFGHPDHGRLLLNLGGMANVTYVRRRGSVDDVVAFDTGPGVAILDAVVRGLVPGSTYDADGQLAARGAADDDLVAELLEQPFFAASPPKSTGREVFGESYAMAMIERVRSRRVGATPEDVIATALRLTVRSIASQVQRWLPQFGPGGDMLVSGGGARNRTLMGQLAELLPGTPVRRFADEFFDGDAKEAVAFAFLGWRTLRREPGNVPSATGARGPRILGRVTPP
ncbi:MAG: anhydro-N-acetylmuramic acid kinase [Gemmatimonadetes bacterium RBG_16_66_8]|nr:MAG: anhydro-N-acetylmuramic acid kinase [Gemmatimonadetes bacterium RBG_16_66_8]